MKPILRCIALLLGVLSYSQSPGNVSGHSLWLNPEPKANGTATDTTAKSSAKSSFNFNPSLLELENSGEFKDLLKQQYSLFVVFKSDTDDELPILTLSKGRERTYLTNKQVLSQSETVYKKVDSKKGIILSYIVSNDNKSRRNNLLKIEDFYYGDNTGGQQLMEIIFYPRLLAPVERAKVETYLSLKYGLSIVGSFDYLASSGAKLWSSDEAKSFGKHITGIGRDDKMGLYQKQSMNAENDGIAMGFDTIKQANTENSKKLADETFVLWADNGAPALFSKSKGFEKMQVISRLWKVNVINPVYTDSLSTQLRISKKDMPAIEEPSAGVKMPLWLAINRAVSNKMNYINAEYYRQVREDSLYVYFDGIIWDSDRSKSDIFTLVKAPDFFFEYNVSPIACDDPVGKTDMTIKIVGGSSPFTLSLSGQQQREGSASEGEYTFTGLPSGEYSLTVTDRLGNVQRSVVNFSALAGLDLGIDPVWFLDRSGKVLVAPKTISAGALSFQWIRDKDVISDKPTVELNRSGEYICRVTNNEGCSKDVAFKVLDYTQSLNSGWSIYPNPVSQGDEFTIAFNLMEETDVILKIASMDGKIVSTERLGAIKKALYRKSLPTSGIYLVTVILGSQSETAKLIVE